MNTQLPADLEQFVQAKVRSGRFSSPEEAIAARACVCSESRKRPKTPASWRASTRAWRICAGRTQPLAEAFADIQRSLNLPHGSAIFFFFFFFLLLVEHVCPFPTGAVGLIYGSSDEIPALVRELINHRHYSRTAAEFSNSWREYHNSRRLLREMEAVAGAFRNDAARFPAAKPAKALSSDAHRMRIGCLLGYGGPQIGHLIQVLSDSYGAEALIVEPGNPELAPRHGLLPGLKVVRTRNAFLPYSLEGRIEYVLDATRIMNDLAAGHSSYLLHVHPSCPIETSKRPPFVVYYSYESIPHYGELDVELNRQLRESIMWWYSRRKTGPPWNWPESGSSALSSSSTIVRR